MNSAKNGDHYWVIAHVTPSRDNGEIVGYHSTRRVPNHQIIRDVIEPLYDQLRSLEQSAMNRKDGLEKSLAALNGILEEKGQSYSEFISGLMRG